MTSRGLNTRSQAQDALSQAGQLMLKDIEANHSAELNASVNLKSALTA